MKRQLIAQHALAVHASHRAEEPWRGFFDTMERLKTAMLGKGRRRVGKEARVPAR